MADLAGWPRFFIGVTMGLDINGVVSLAIGKAILIGTDIIVGFSELSLW